MFLNRRQCILPLLDFAYLDRHMREGKAAIATAQNVPPSETCKEAEMLLDPALAFEEKSSRSI